MELKKCALPWLVLSLLACDKPQSDAAQAVTTASVSSQPPVPSAPPVPVPPPAAVKTLKKKNASECKAHPAAIDFGDDAALEREVRKKVGKDAGAITPADLAAVKSINLVNATVHQIDPCIFPMFTSLTNLFLGSGEYDDLTPIQKLTTLDSLRISFSVVRDLRPIEGLKRLDRLDLSHTLIGDDDLKPVGSLVNLTELMLDEDSVSDLTPVSNLKKLQRLSIKKTNVKNLAPLSSLTGLKFVYIADTPVSDITPVQPLMAGGMKLIRN
jgi:internalin A